MTSQTCSQCMLDSGRAPLCHQFFFFVEMESPLPQVAEFKYPEILLVRECRIKRGTDRQISEDWQSS